MFASLLKVLPPDVSRDVTWERFAATLARESGINPQQITPDSPLLLPCKGTWGHVKEALFFVAMMWLAMLLLVVVL